MRILVINPNTTASMTAGIAAVAHAAAGDDSQIEVTNPEHGPASIEGYYDEVFSVPGLLEEIAKGERAGFDGYVIACFDDTGLDAARCLAAGPVVGICEASVHMATMLCHRFSVITTLERSVPALNGLMSRYGVAERCTVRAANIPVLDLEDAATDAEAILSEHITTAMRDDGSEAIVLGCAGMADLADSLSAKFSIPVLDGVRCAVRQVEALVGIGLKTSKIRGYATPLSKDYAGAMSPWAPQKMQQD